MRYSSMFLALSLAFVLSSCQKELQSDDSNAVQMEFVACFGEEGTKTVRLSDCKTYWSPNDTIQIFQGSYSGTFVSSNTDIARTASFVGTMNGQAQDASDYWAVYPQDEDNAFIDWAVCVPIHTTQMGKDGSFADKEFPTVAKSSCKTLSFQNICGGIKFRVVNDDITKVILKGNNVEVISGYAIVTFENSHPSVNEISSSQFTQASKRIVLYAPDYGCFTPGTYYYMTVPPTSFSKGFSLTFCNSESKEATYSTDKAITVSRSKFGVLDDLDEGLVFQEGEEMRKAKEREILDTLYHALDGDNWSSRNNWLSDKPVGEWEGITTDGDGFVRQIWLTDSNIKGSLPNAICSLSHLELVTIVGGLTGTIPEDIKKLSNLQQFYLTCNNYDDVNRLGGSIPEGITSMPKLRAFYVYDSQLSGKIPENIGNLTNLEAFVISPFAGEGPLPSSMAKLTKMKNLNLSHMALNCEFPEEILKMANLEHLCLNSCGLKGSLPVGINSLTSLQNLNLNSNDLSGPIPSCFNSLSSLKWLDLSENSFISFPDLSGCTSLSSLQILGNKAEMTFDNGMWGPSLTSVDLMGSHITGTITSAIGLAVNLESLNVRDNNLSGTLPSEFGLLTKLVSANLSKNHFSGNLPSSLANLTELQSLIINNNEFTGSIPDSFSALIKLGSFDAYNNYMSGSISESVVMMDVFSNWQLTPQYNDGKFIYDLYESTDYSQHKKVTLIHPATKGNGVNFVLMGDAYTDKDIAAGEYDYAMNLACEALFEIEPFKSFEDYFNVYVIKLVSKNGHYVGETALDIDYDPIGGSDGYSHYGQSYDIVEQVMPGLDKDQLTIGVIVNRIPDGGACSECFIGSHGDPPSPDDTPYGSGLSISVVSNRYIKGQDGIDSFKKVFVHEIGHGFGKLGDEYYTYEGEISEENKTQAEQFHKYGWMCNVSCDTTNVPWKHYLSLPEYQAENIGIYEGALVCTLGAWRSTPTSIMSCDYNNYPYFNAISREMIYRRIHLIADGPEWKFDFDEFLEWDKRNLQ